MIDPSSHERVNTTCDTKYLSQTRVETSVRHSYSVNNAYLLLFIRNAIHLLPSHANDFSEKNGKSA